MASPAAAERATSQEAANLEGLSLIPSPFLRIPSPHSARSGASAALRRGSPRHYNSDAQMTAVAV